MNVFHLYLYFPQNLDKYISNSEELELFIKDFQFTLERADCESGAILYYSNSNKELFISEQKAIADLVEYFGILDFEETINYLLQDSNANNWELEPLHDVKEKSSFYKQWISSNRNVGEYIPDIIKEIAEREFRIENKKEEKCLLINILKYFSATSPFTIIRDSIDNKPLMLTIDFVSNFHELDSWLLMHREKRNYNMNDNRHIENNPAYLKAKSPLIGGIGGKRNAALLLQNALGDKKEIGFLINFDTSNNCYIRFEYENDNPQNSFHGFHFVKPKTHERDLMEEDNIPERVKNIIAFRNQGK